MAAVLCPIPSSPPLPDRASSSNVRFSSCSSVVVVGSRRRPECFLPTPDPSPLPSRVPSPSPKPPPSSMLLVVVHHILDWFHFQSSSTDISHPLHPSSEPSLLPMSSASESTPEDSNLLLSHKSRFPHISFSANHLPILTVILLFPLSTVLVFLSLYTLPISLTWPRTITDLAQLGTELHGYSQSGIRPMAHVVGVMSITAIWKHAWSIPGSVVWNVLAGALFSPPFAVLLLSALTMIGSACATLLSAPLAPLLSRFFPRALDMTRSALQGSSGSESEKGDSTSSAWVRLSVLRLIGVVPWSGINIACGVSGVPLSDCMLGAFIGTLPWTAVTCQIGDILQTVASHPTSPASQTVSSLLTSPAIIMKLALLSFLSLAPILARDRLKALIISDVDTDTPITDDERSARRSSWAQGWRAKIRAASQSRRRRDETELEELVREKRSLE